ncbi:MAG: membrane protein insertion efficiency factor YidD [Candidatus Scalindua sp. AMX11]|nr:MAG: membrane protein insertion efficiency factor YidD [Candidatus Scalindua sp.]NOG84414.1 membrane protein insertion efficiency factor YidD [Planctomycetota bacterium]RZV72469.1 MAG: membrane protein insertion efficiency factor YidD [Candidatus Scalindua sp. SCAELEC01]TDE64624.1 MAG: membrane protein insertion efficiency factor YidD [Candidatus Scalindua sp. AMX11]
MKYLLIKIIQIYQVLLAHLFNPSCRFSPSCSQYAIDAIEKRGIFVGVLKGIWRILRCNPFGGSGYDPVK